MSKKIATAATMRTLVGYLYSGFVILESFKRKAKAISWLRTLTTWS